MHRCDPQTSLRLRVLLERYGLQLALLDDAAAIPGSYWGAHAGGDYDEENAVCYLEILLAQQFGLAAQEICADMDAWGYTFRLGSAYAWFTHDAEDARAWLLRNGLITSQGAPTWRCRESRA